MNIQTKISSRIETIEIHDLVDILKTDSKNLFTMLKNITEEDDKELSSWLNINEKTFREQKNTTKSVKPLTVEHTVMLISLFSHGIEIFGNAKQFKKWLNTPNFHFNNKPPLNFIHIISDIKFIDDRLTGLEYGDNA